MVGYQIGEEGANHRVWQKIVKATDANGNFTCQTNRAYIELATGLNYKDPTTGKWLPSKEEIDAYPGGAIAQYGQHRVIFANDLNTAGAIDLQMPGGQEMKSDVLGLSYYDTASGKSVLIAGVQDSQGQIVSSNEVLYPNAFKGLKASVLYKYTLAGLEQDVVLQAQPPSPESFGLSSTSCVMQVLTEFTTAPTPTIHSLAVGTTTNGPLTDEWLNFGAMRMVPGKAFLLGTNSPPARVCKQWLDVGGRTVLVESVPLPAISGSLSQLPVVAQAALKPKAGSVQYVVSSRRLLPPPRTGNGTKTEMELASSGGPARGLVLDYITVNGDPENVTFQGDTTYYVSAPLYLSGTTTFQGGSVLKYANNAFVDLSESTQINCLTAPYRPVIFTAKDDNSVGEAIPGSTGGPSGYYANPAIYYFPYGYGSLSLTNFRIAYAYQAVFASAPNMTVTLRDGQIVNCGTGFYTPGQTSAYLENMLFAKVQPLDLYLANVQAQNVTFDGQYSSLVAPAGSGPNYNVTLNLVNCILANFTVFSTVSGITPTGDHNGFNNNYNYPPTFGSSPIPCTSNPFQTAGGGHYYLNFNNGPNGGVLFHNAGSTSIDPVLLDSLQTKTTQPPQVHNGDQITSDSFTAQVPRDNASTPDLGYHYDPLDYVFQNSTVNSQTITTITFPAGTAVGWQGLGLSFSVNNPYCKVSFAGTAFHPCYFVRCNTVQEADYSGDGTGLAGSSEEPELAATFTRFSALGDNAAFFDGNYVNADSSFYRAIYNCEFWDGQIGGNAVEYLELKCWNCLFDVSFINFSVAAGSTGNYFDLQNCTLHGGKLALVDPFNSQGNPVNDFIIHDSAIDGTALLFDVSSRDSPSFSYNAYLNGASPLPYDSSDQIVSPFNWQSGPLGNFYLPPPPCALIDNGDQPASQINVVVDGATSATEPLSEFTTQTTQDSDINTVDIGYHYPFVLLKGDVLVSGNIAGAFSNGSDEIDTYRFGDGSFFRSFQAATEGSGRGLAIYNGNFYYTELNDGDVHICSYGTYGSGPNPMVDSGSLPVAPTPQWRPGVGTQDLAFHNGTLYVLTGYPLDNPPTYNSLQVFELNLTTGEKIGNPINISPPKPDPRGVGVTGTSDGFAVLPNGDFLINDYDGADGFPSDPATIYREYSATSVQPLAGGLVIDVSSFSTAVGFTVDGSTGVTCAPDGTLYFIVGQVDASGLYFDTQAIVHTDSNGGYLSSQVINSQGFEDIDVLVGQ